MGMIRPLSILIPVIIGSVAKAKGNKIGRESERNGIDGWIGAEVSGPDKRQLPDVTRKRDQIATTSDHLSPDKLSGSVMGRRGAENCPQLRLGTVLRLAGYTGWAGGMAQADKMHCLRRLQNEH